MGVICLVYCIRVPLTHLILFSEGAFLALEEKYLSFEQATPSSLQVSTVRQTCLDVIFPIPFETDLVFSCIPPPWMEKSYLAALPPWPPSIENVLVQQLFVPLLHSLQRRGIPPTILCAKYYSPIFHLEKVRLDNDSVSLLSSIRSIWQQCANSKGNIKWPLMGGEIGEECHTSPVKLLTLWIHRHHSWSSNTICHSSNAKIYDLWINSI